MPPHCDTLDGPVVRAAAHALEEGQVALVLPYVPREGEDEVTEAFAKALKLRGQGDEAKELADRFLFETVVRIHAPARASPSPASSRRASTAAR